ncbi:DUF2680 domain-containing protein [Salibacterium aidingense]|uniref:DUF2680 domain-containing protein n=1 Tax=Salibacterium aidingense TaxID=384933 RepID=UPI003BE9DD7B
MKKKGFLILLAAALFFTVGPQQMSAGEFHEDWKQVELTEPQKKELAEIHSSILEQKKTLIDKYVEFGVIPKEKRETIKKHLDKGYAQLEDNEFIPKHPHPNKKKK